MRTPFIISILVTTALAAHAGELTKSFNYESQIGVAEINVAAYGCLAIANDTLQQGETIMLIDPTAPQRVINATIRKKLILNCSRNTDFPRGTSFYSFRAGNEPLDPSLAIVRFNGDPRTVNDSIRADLNGDWLFESFRVCAGNEGLHLSVWAGEPLRTNRVWHAYYPLYYDVEPTCTEKDSGE